jgi:Pyruvate/2-oxoacid:ferredoxin oxidoreductase gamma subunit
MVLNRLCRYAFLFEEAKKVEGDGTALTENTVMVGAVLNMAERTI